MSSKTPPINEIYWHASQLASERERSEYLDCVCQGDKSVRALLDQLLELQPRAEQFPETLDATTPLIDDSPVEAAGAVIGNYKLLEQIGHGGMGVVYMAEQTRPVRRKVALKILKPGMDTHEIVGRFEQERQALAIMDHPHIARVFDAGTSPSGRPFFVMELVRGVSITKFCTQQQLNSEQRLRLLVQVCYAVHHAHQKGIIHRDLKPANVMVELHDVTPVPKVIDFGVAKAIHGRLIDRTLFTGFVQMIGTPLYMSPEQTELNALDVDTRSDVYSLGVLLYELLTGSTPFDRQRISDAGYDEIQRIIREEEPPRPSTRISTLNAKGASTVSATVENGVPGFAKRLRHELDWVVMKALEKDRTRRYQSASELAADIERFLDDEPVLAKPPSLTYRLGKLAQRNRAALTLFVSVAAALLLGTTVSVWQAVRATVAQELAEDRAEIAVSAWADAKVQKSRADAARIQSDERLYVANMKLASDAIRIGDIPRAATLLEQHRPAANSIRNPGFEWRYLNRLIDVRPDWRMNISAWGQYVRLSPDGTLLAVAARDGSAQVCDARTGKVLQRFGSLFECNSVAWSPDGRQIVTASGDGAVRFWNVEASTTVKSSLLSNLVSAFTDRPTQIIAAHQDPINDAMYTTDGQTLITAGDDSLIRLWNVQTGEALATLTGHSREIEQLAVSADGTWIASASSDETVAVWDAQTHQQRFAHASSQNPGRMVCVAFSPDGNLVAAGDIDGNLVLGDITSEKWAQAKLVDGIESVAFMNNPLRVITGDRGGSVQLWELTREPDMTPKISSTPLARWIAHQGRVQSLAVDHQYAQVITGSRDNTVAAWSVETSTPAWRRPNAEDFCMISDAEMVVCGRELKLVDVESRETKDHFLPSETGWKLIQKSRDKPRVAVASNHTVVVYDLAKKQEILRQDFTSKIHCLAISPDGNRIAMSWWNQRDSIDVLNVADASRDILPARQCNALEFSPDSLRLAVGHMDDVFVHDLRRRSNGVAPPSSELDSSGSSEIRDAESRRRPSFLHLMGHDSTLTDVKFSRDGSRLATVSSDRHLMLWDAATGERIASVPAHHADAIAATFSADGLTIATVGEDGAARLWHTATLQPLLELALPGDTYGDRVELAADQSRLLVHTEDDQIIVYDTKAPQYPKTK